MELNNDLILKIILPVIGVVGTWLSKDKVSGWLGIKKQENDVAGGNLQNVQKALDLWQEMLDDAVKRHKAQIVELEDIISKVKEDVNRLQEINEELNNTIFEQSKTILFQADIIKQYKIDLKSEDEDKS